MPLSVLPSSIFLLSPADVKLGRLTTNLDHPQQGYFEPPTAAKCITTGYKFAGHHTHGNGKSFRSTLTRLISANLYIVSESSLQILPCHGTSYMLDNSDAWFDEALALEPTKNWIERRVRNGDDIYMIVGMRALTNPHIAAASARTHEAGGGGTMPLGLSMIGGGAPGSGLADPAIHGGHQVLDNTNSELIVPGERLYSLQYRRVKYTLFSRRAADTPRLGDSRHWLCFEDNSRGAVGDSSGDEDDDEDDDEEQDARQDDYVNTITVSLEEVDNIGEEWSAENIEDDLVYFQPRS